MFCAPGAFVMNGARHAFFSGSALASDKNIGVGGSHSADQIENFAHARRFADDSAKGLSLLDFVLQTGILEMEVAKT